MFIYKFLIIYLIVSCSVLAKDNRKNNQAKMIKKIKMVEHLDLDEKQSEKLFVREKDLEKQIKIINDKKNALRHKMKKARQNGNMSQTQVDMLIEEMHELDRQRKSLKENHQKGVSDILTPSQRLKYVNFDHHFKNEMKDKIRKKPQRSKKNRRPK
tara:strand:+ start:379 stop:846 length:468 start_codon:yes stop_codon:yes gene_type:complete